MQSKCNYCSYKHKALPLFFFKFKTTWKLLTCPQNKFKQMSLGIVTVTAFIKGSMKFYAKTEFNFISEF